MPSLVTEAEKTVFTGDFQNLYDTFKRELIVHKEPKKVVENPNNVLYAGYKPQNQAVTTFIPQSGVYQGMITYKDIQDANDVSDIGHQYFAGDVRIKVEQDAHDYLKEGRTEGVSIDGNLYRVITSDAVKNFFGFKLYVYHLEETR
jgi:predicted transport protein